MTYRLRKSELRAAAARKSARQPGRRASAVGATMGAVGALALTPMLSDPAKAEFPDTSAGPDGFGYYYYTSDDPQGPTAQWHDISGSGTALGIDGMMSQVEEFDMGDVVFPFYGCDFSAVTVSQFGGVAFGSPTAFMTGNNNPDMIPFNDPGFEGDSDWSAGLIDELDEQEGVDRFSCEFLASADDPDPMFLWEGARTIFGVGGSGNPGIFDYPTIHVFNTALDADEDGAGAADQGIWAENFDNCPVTSPNAATACSIVQWRDDHNSDEGEAAADADVAEFQLVMFDNGDILLNYLDVDLDGNGGDAATSAGGEATVGIQGYYLEPGDLNGPTWGLEYSVNQASLQNNFSILLTATEQVAPEEPAEEEEEAGGGGTPAGPPQVTINSPPSNAPVVLPPATPGEPYSFTLPADTFINERGDPPTAVLANQTGGQPLPDWLVWDPETLTFSGIPPFDEQTPGAAPLAAKINARLIVPVVLTAQYEDGRTGTLALQLSFIDNLAPSVGYWSAVGQRGLVIAVEPRASDGLTFLGLGTYAQDGSATWLTSFLEDQGDGSFVGTLSSYAGGPAVFGGGGGTLTATPGASVSLAFDGTDVATVTVGDDSFTIRPTELFFVPLAPGGRTGDPEPGWWWDASRSGEGVFIETQAFNLRMTIFGYDDAGNPVFYQGSGGQIGTGKFTAQLTRPSGPADSPTTAEDLGIATLSVGEGGTTAMLTLPNGDVRMLSRFSF